MAALLHSVRQDTRPLVFAATHAVCAAGALDQFVLVSIAVPSRGTGFGPSHPRLRSEGKTTAGAEVPQLP